MNIVCGLPGPGGAWRRAAEWLGLNLMELNPNRVLDAFRAVKPDVVLLSEAWLTYVPLGRFLASYTGKLAILKQPGVRPLHWRDVDLFLTDQLLFCSPDTLWLRPALDARPDTPPGTVRPEFACDVALVGHYHRELEPYLLPLCASFLRVKVFGDGPFTMPQYLGSIAPSEVADVYASARVSVDLAGEPSRVLSIWASGGYCVTARPFQKTGVQLLDATPGESDPAKFVALVRQKVSTGATSVLPSRGEDQLLQDTFAHRLKEILEQLA